MNYEITIFGETTQVIKIKAKAMGKTVEPQGVLLTFYSEVPEMHTVTKCTQDLLFIKEAFRVHITEDE